jgi:hypothetical protein
LTGAFLSTVTIEFVVTASCSTTTVTVREA